MASPWRRFEALPPHPIQKVWKSYNPPWRGGRQSSRFSVAENSANGTVAGTIAATNLGVNALVYTQSHVDYLAEVIIETCARAAALPGYRIVSVAPALRHLTARLEPIPL